MESLDQILHALDSHDMVRFRFLFEKQCGSLIEAFSGRLSAPLTECERLICYQQALGFTSKKIADVMGITPSTVYTHTRNIHLSGAESRKWLKSELPTFSAE